MTQAIGEVQTTDEAASLPITMTYQEFLEWADGENAEWVEGKVFLMGPLSVAHQNLGRFMLRLLSEWAEETQAGDVFYEKFQMKTGPNLPGREPDILFVAAQNRHRLRPNHLEGPADLAVEIVSPESQERDRVTKMQEYATGGVREYWLLDPVRNEALFYVLTLGNVYAQVLPDAGNLYHCAVMPGLWLRVDWLWQSPLPALRVVRQAWGFA